MYAKKHPNWCVEPNESRHVFVCSNPRILPRPISMSGDHKMWTLPGKMHQGLADQLKQVNDAWLRDVVSSGAKKAVVAPAVRR